MTPPQRFVIPRDPLKADALPSELGELATAAEWKRASIVYCRVRVQENQGRPTAEKRNSALLSPQEYALLGVHGLRSPNTIRRYWRAWDNAIVEGLVQPVSLGDEVELPDAEWNDYYHPATPDCPSWANTSQRETAPIDGCRDRHRDDLGWGDCPPVASNVEEPDRRQQPPCEPPEVLNARALRWVDFYLGGMPWGMQHQAKALLVAVQDVTDWGGSREATLAQIGLIRLQLNDIERTVRGESGDDE